MNGFKLNNGGWVGESVPRVSGTETPSRENSGEVQELLKHTRKKPRHR